MSAPRSLLAAGLLAALLVACGRGQEAATEALAVQALEAQTDVQAELKTGDGENTLTLQTADGTMQHTTGADVALPEDFPEDVVLPDDYTVVSVMKLGPSRSVVLRSPEPITVLYERYKAGQAGQGWKETMSMQGAEGAALGFEKDRRGMLVNLRPDLEGQTTVSLSLQAP